MLFLAFLVLVPRTILGFLAVQWIWRSTDRRDLLLKVFLAGPIGLGLSSLLSFLWIWAGLDLELYAWSETGLVLLAALVVLLKQRSVLLSYLRNLRITISKAEAIWLGFLLIALLIYTGEFWLHSLENPHGRWDAWSNWVVAARFVFRGGAHWTNTFLRTPDHPDYPLLLAMSNAISWALLPRESVRGPMALAFFFNLNFAGLFFALLYRLRGMLQASLGTVVLITMPFVAYNGMTLHADLPEAYFFLASAGLITIFHANRVGALPLLSGLLAGLAAWAKNEGLAFMIIALAAWAWIGARWTERTAIRSYLLGLAIPLLVITLFKVYLAPRNSEFNTGHDIFALLKDLDRYRLILTTIARGLWSVSNDPVNIIVVLILYGLLVGKTGHPYGAAGVVVLMALAQLASYLLAYLITASDLNWHLSTSHSRLYLHVVPLILLSLFLWLKTPQEMLPTGQSPS